MPKKRKVKNRKTSPTPSMPSRKRRAATRVVQVSRRVSRRAAASRFNVQRMVPAPIKRGFTGIGAYDVVQRISTRLNVGGPAPRIAGMGLAFLTGGVEGTIGAVAVDAADQGFIGSSLFAGNGGGIANGNGGGVEAV